MQDLLKAVQTLRRPRLLIRAARHVHMNLADAKHYGVSNAWQTTLCADAAQLAAERDIEIECPPAG